MSDQDWYIQEWAAYRGKRQAGLTNDLDWPKNTAFRIWHSKQPYRRDVVNKVAAWLDIEPFELLMHPEHALRIRELQRVIIEIHNTYIEPQSNQEAPSGTDR